MLSYRVFFRSSFLFCLLYTQTLFFTTVCYAAPVTIGPEGGIVSTDTGIVLTIPVNALSQYIQINLLPLDRSSVESTVGSFLPGMRYYNGVIIEMPEPVVLKKPATLEMPNISGESLDEQILAFQILDVGIPYGKQLTVVSRCQSNQSLNIVTTPAEYFSGVKESGEFAFISFESPMGFVAGTVLDPDGTPALAGWVKVMKEDIALPLFASTPSGNADILPLGDFNPIPIPETFSSDLLSIAQSGPYSIVAETPLGYIGTGFTRPAAKEISLVEIRVKEKECEAYQNDPSIQAGLKEAISSAVAGELSKLASDIIQFNPPTISWNGNSIEGRFVMNRAKSSGILSVTFHTSGETEKIGIEEVHDIYGGKLEAKFFEGKVSEIKFILAKPEAEPKGYIQVGSISSTQDNNYDIALSSLADGKTKLMFAQAEVTSKVEVSCTLTIKALPGGDVECPTFTLGVSPLEGDVHVDAIKPIPFFVDVNSPMVVNIDAPTEVLCGTPFEVTINAQDASEFSGIRFIELTSPEANISEKREYSPTGELQGKQIQTVTFTVKYPLSENPPESFTLEAKTQDFLHNDSETRSYKINILDRKIWYVATDGDDINGDGSREKPFRTIQKGVNTAQGGQAVRVAGGSYVGEGNCNTSST